MEHRIFNLMPYGGRDSEFGWTVITPNDTSTEVITAAWSYAVRYTAKGLDLPDHEAAVKKLLERHPSWQAINAKPENIGVNLQLADNDVPENA